MSIAPHKSDRMHMNSKELYDVNIADKIKRSQNERSQHTDETISINLTSFDNEWGDFEEYYSDTQFKINPALSRTSLLLLDYRQFKAARTIQKVFRGWYARHMYAKMRSAAIKIQTEWRRFRAQRHYYRLLENTLQQRIEKQYYRSAQIIQALWRGWWIRENVHDHYRLKRLQVYAAEDLMHCIALKLHHLLRTHQIPGIYSLRNTHCLSKVEQLLASIGFKQHNEQVRMARARRQSKLNDANKLFKHSKFHTDIPYSGPNFQSYCEPKCCAFYNEPDSDKRMYKILRMYELATNGNTRDSRTHGQKKSIKSRTDSIKADPRPPDFCTDVVNSMKRWKILSANNLTVDSNVFKNPENVENFLTEIQSLYSLLQGQCHCNIKLKDGELPECQK